MSVYVDKVHIYCDHENCDNEIMLKSEELGSVDLQSSSVRTPSIVEAISDIAFAEGWFFDPLGWNKASCPNHAFPDYTVHKN